MERHSDHFDIGYRAFFYYKKVDNNFCCQLLLSFILDAYVKLPYTTFSILIYRSNLLRLLCIIKIIIVDYYPCVFQTLKLSISDFEIVSTSCNWSYFGLLLPRRSGIQCCNLYIEGECCAISSYDNVRVTYIHPSSSVGLNNFGIIFNELWFVLPALCYLLFYASFYSSHMG